MKHGRSRSRESWRDNCGQPLGRLLAKMRRRLPTRILFRFAISFTFISASFWVIPLLSFFDSSSPSTRALSSVTSPDDSVKRSKMSSSSSRIRIWIDNCARFFPLGNLRLLFEQLKLTRSAHDCYISPQSCAATQTISPYNCLNNGLKLNATLGQS